MSHVLTPAQMRATYAELMKRSLDSEIKTELEGIYENTAGFTNEAVCAAEAQNFADLASLAGYATGAEQDEKPTPAKKAASQGRKGAPKPGAKRQKQRTAAKKASAPEIPQPAPVPATRLLADLDDDACRELVKENDRIARQARKDAELADYKAKQLASGKDPKEVEALTYSDMRQRRTLREVVEPAANHLVTSIVRHMAGKSEQLKRLSPDLQKLHDQLQEQAAQHVAEFAKKEAKWVNETMLAAMQKANEEVKEPA